MKDLRVGAINYGIRRVEGVFNKLWKQKSSKERTYVFKLIVGARLESAGKQGVSFG